MNNIEKLAIVIKSHVDDLHRCEQVMRDFDEHTFHDTADEINKAAKELEEAFAKELQQSSEPVAELATNPVFIYNHYTATLLVKDDAHPKTVGLVKGVKLFTHAPATVPLEKYNKLLDGIRNALYQDLNDIKPYLRKLIAEAEGK